MCGGGKGKCHASQCCIIDYACFSRKTKESIVKECGMHLDPRSRISCVSGLACDRRPFALRKADAVGGWMDGLID